EIDTAIDLDGKLWQAWLTRTKLASDAGDNALMLDAAKHLIQLRTDYPVGYTYRGDAQRRLKQEELAARDYFDALVTGDGDPRAVKQLKELHYPAAEPAFNTDVHDAAAFASTLEDLRHTAPRVDHESIMVLTKRRLRV